MTIRCQSICVMLIMLVSTLLLCGCQRQYGPEEVKTIAVKNLDLFKQAAQLSIDKKLSFPISSYELKQVDGLTKAELSIYQRCQKIGIKDLYYSKADDYVKFFFNYEPRKQAILYIPPESDFERPEEVLAYYDVFDDESKIEEVIELDENWYYYRCEW